MEHPVPPHNAEYYSDVYYTSKYQTPFHFMCERPANSNAWQIWMKYGDARIAISTEQFTPLPFRMIGSRSEMLRKLGELSEFLDKTFTPETPKNHLEEVIHEKRHLPYQ